MGMISPQLSPSLTIVFKTTFMSANVRVFMDLFRCMVLALGMLCRLTSREPFGEDYLADNTGFPCPGSRIPLSNRV
jgi:hypothetical protein